MKNIFLSGFLFILALQAAHAQSHDQIKKEIEKIIKYDTEISFNNIPGFIIGIVDGDSTFIIPFGSQKKDSQGIISDTAIFEIGGLTKVFTAHLCHELVQRNMIRYKEQVNFYLDAAHRNSHLDHLVIENLITHTSGFPTRPPNMGLKEIVGQNLYSGYTKGDLLSYYRTASKLPKNGEYIYSHINYALLELIIEKATGMPFEEVLERYVLHPNQMTRSAITLSADQEATSGYDRAGRETSLWSFASFGASEGLKSTAGDLCRYIRQYMKLLDCESTLKQNLTEFKRITGYKKSYVSYGWHMFRNKKGSNIYLHSGKTDGHAASIHFVPESKTAVVLLTNGIGKMDGLATLVLRMINNNWKRKNG